MTDKPEFGYKTDRGWHFDDKYTFKVISHSPADLTKLRDNYMGAFKPVTGEPHPSGLGTMPQSGQQPLQQQQGAPAPSSGVIIKIAATHAGLITRNNGFYMPDRMRAAASTWTDHYNKPIQVHHDDHSDPVGRVIAARYVDTSMSAVTNFKNHALRDNYKKEVGKADSDFFSKFVSDKTSFISKLNMIKLMDSVLQDPNYQGVGYIELTAHITDPDAIQKVLDGRYITGSVGAISDKAVCSICDTDWLESEHCGHRPGRMYDSRKCVVIAGNLEYDEYSFVNTPADRYSGVLKIENSFTGIANQDSAITYFPVFDSTKEDSNMSGLNETTTEEISVAENTGVQVQDSVVVTDEFTALFDKVLDGTLTSEESEQVYTLMLEEMDKDVIEDAQLSSEKRKSLPSSAFCGPARSFPAHDCAHVSAARKLMGRYKGEGDKSKIAACVDRKAKALGCESKDELSKQEVVAKVEDSVADTVTPVIQDLTEKPLTVSLIVDGVISSPEEKLVMLDSIIDSLKATFADQLVSVLVSKGLSIPVEVKAELNDEISKLTLEVSKHESVIGELRDQLSALRKEIKSAYDDVIAVEDQLISAKEQTRALKTSKATLMTVLDGKMASESDFTSLTDEVLDNTLNTLNKSLDLVKISDRLNSGLSRNPQEQVEAPTGLTESVNEPKPHQPTYATQSYVDEIYRRILLSDGVVKAQNFYTEQVKLGRASPKAR